MKSELFKQAWAFVKITGKSFSECLRKSWQNFKLKSAMQTKIVEFRYMKLNGDVRQAFGRLYDLPETKGEKKANENLFTYYDTVVGGFRSFYKFNLI